ncbi:hypothetical protein AB0C13_26715, partial [Streptomyces sp. NPDC049099]
ARAGGGGGAAGGTARGVRAAAVRAPRRPPGHFGETEFREVADIIAEALKGEQSDDELRARVGKLAAAFPLYPHLNGDPA